MLCHPLVSKIYPLPFSFSYVKLVINHLKCFYFFCSDANNSLLDEFYLFYISFSISFLFRICDLSLIFFSDIHYNTFHFHRSYNENHTQFIQTDTILTASRIIIKYPYFLFCKQFYKFSCINIFST